MSTKYIASNWRLPNKAGVDSYLNDNYGLDFTGSTQFINVGTVSNFQGSTTQASVSVWFNYDTTGGYVYNIDNGLGCALIVSNTQIDVYIGNIAFRSTSVSLSSGNWNNFILTIDFSESNNIDKFKGYLNGTLLTNENSSNINTIPTGDFIIGARRSSSNYFNGKISELAIFDYTLSEAQISTLYGSSSLGAGNPMALKPAPIAYYNLADNSSGNPLTQPNEAVEDSSVFDFDGTNYIETSAIDLGLENTISFWAKSDGVFFNGMVWGGTLSGNYVVFLTNANNIFYRVGGAANQFNNSDIVSALGSGNWFHCALVRNNGGADVACYINGYLKQTITGISGSSNNTIVQNIGARSIADFKINGELSNIAIWNSDQSSEISNIYNSGVPATTYTNTPTAWYKLDQSANWEADSTGAWQIPDAVSAYPQSFEFISSDTSQINLGDVTYLDGASELTLSAWVKPTAAGTAAADGIFGKDGPTRGFYLATYTGNKFRFFVSTTGSSNDSFNSNASYTIGEWIHLAATWDGSNMKIYINGSEDNSRTTTNATGTLQDNSNPFEIGNLGNFGGPLNAFLSNAQVWTTALPATGTDSIETLYNSGVPLTTAIATDNLKAWYKLDNTATFSTNWSVPDASGNGNTGTSSGMTEQNLVNNNVSVLNGESSGMTSANLVLTDLTRNLPYDSYSFSFDGSSDYIETPSIDVTGVKSFSFWLKRNSTTTNDGAVMTFVNSGKTDDYMAIGLWNGSADTGALLNAVTDNAGNTVKSSSSEIPSDVWIHFVVVKSATAITAMYINGVSETMDSGGMYYANATAPQSYLVRANFSGLNLYANINLSNVSIFNQALTSTEVLKLYANGVPQDLASFSPSPIAWWTLGSNSFFNGSNFICKDLIGSNDGTSVNAGVDALQGNTPRSEANGTGSNMDIPTNLEGQTKYSSNNSWSINQSESARVQDTP